MSNLTKAQLYQICRKYKYIILRLSDNSTMGLNCKVGRLKLHDGYKNNNAISAFISYHECNLNEYISSKAPFI